MAKSRKTVPNNKSGIEKLPNNKPVKYTIKTDSGKPNYIGTAKKGRVQDRLKEHLPGGKDYVPGSKVKIEQHSSIREAQKSENRSIKRSKPKYNKNGK
jgi:excinuclease UvrABC nuclease subunit